VIDPSANPRRPRPLRRFVLAQLAFWTPVILAFGLIELALWRSGEYVSCRDVVEQQARPGSGTLWLRGYADQDFPRYKWLGFQKKRPRVIALGSSRAMHLRAEMFGREGASFYNLGGAVRSLADLEAWIDAVPDDLLPKVILLEVDVWWLDESWPGQELFTEGISRDHLQWQTHLTAMRGLLFSQRRQFAVRMLAHGRRPDRVGLRAELLDEGFRPDGSRQTWRPPPSPQKSRAYLDAINRNWSAAESTGATEASEPSRLSRERFAQLDRLLSRLEARGVTVLGFASAFTGAFVDARQSDPRSRRVWVDFRDEIPKLFAKHNMPFVMAMRTSDLGLDDRYMWDSHHPNDTFHLYVLRALLRDPKASQALPTTGRAVEAAIASPKTNVWYPDLTFGRRLMHESGSITEGAR
jgi:hypothetical protein